MMTERPIYKEYPAPDILIIRDYPDHWEYYPAYDPMPEILDYMARILTEAGEIPVSD